MKNEKAKIKHLGNLDVGHPRGCPTSKSGFTLVELIVALGLFTVVMMISTSALLSLADTNRKVQSMRIAFDNLNLALESMSREIRMGINYHCGWTSGAIVPTNCLLGVGANSLAFRSQSGNDMIYRLNGATIERSKNGGAIWSALTAPEITVNSLKFYVWGATSADDDQPIVLITITGTAGKNITTDFTVQTTVTRRIPK